MRGIAAIGAAALAAFSPLGPGIRLMREIGPREPRQVKTTHVDDPADIPSRQVRRKLERQRAKRA